MRPGLALFIGRLARVGRSRQDLLLENVARRYHLMLCERRPRVTEVDRVRWAPLRRRWSGGRPSLVILHPDTVGRWHRTGGRRCWPWKRRPPRPGRRRIPVEARGLILRRARENPSWGAVRIRAERRTLGSAVRAETVRRSRRQAMRRPPSQRWRTVLPNPRGVLWAANCCPGPTRTVGTVDVFFLIAHARRRIESVNLTAHPTAAWTWQQLIEATAWTQRPRSLIRDRARADGRDGVARTQRLGIGPIWTPVRAPQANAVAERWVGTLRRACVHHIIPLNARPLQRIVQECVASDNETRPHRPLALHPPAGPRAPQRHGRVVAPPMLGGLQHRYERAAA